MQNARVESVNVGAVETLVLPDGQPLTSAIRKRPSDGALEIGPCGLVGDEWHDPAHGGPNRAIHAFSAEYYELFGPLLGIVPDVPLVGENLTVRGFTDEQAHVGDVVRVGSAILQITMPTERCRNPGRVIGAPNLMKLMVENLRTGFYLRVLEPGRVQRADAWILESPGDSSWSIQALSHAMYREVENPQRVAELQALHALAPEWKQRLAVLHQRRIGGGSSPT